MDLLTTIFVTFFAGMGAGLGTGFAGHECRCCHQSAAYSFSRH